MPATHSPLLFPETLKSPGLWDALGSIHGLSRKDFDWLAHIQLATQHLRSQQSPPMLAQRILLNIDGSPTVPLTGSFVLGATPDDRGEILYTPYGGIKKHHSRADLLEQLETRLNTPADAERLLAFLPISRRKQFWKPVESASRLKPLPAMYSMTNKQQLRGHNASTAKPCSSNCSTCPR